MKAKRFLFRSAVWVSATLVLLSSAACNSIIAPAEINVTIDDNGKTQTVEGREDMTVRELLAKAKISVGAKDLVNPPVDTVWADVAADGISVQRYAKVIFTDGELSQEVQMVGGTVGQAFKLTVFDKEVYTTGVPMDERLVDGEKIVLTKKGEEQTTEQTTAAPATEPTEPPTTTAPAPVGGGIVSDGEGGYRYGGDDGFCGGVTVDGVDWTVINGRAYRVETDADRTLFAAACDVAKCTDSSMSKEEKLRSAFHYLQDNYLEGVRRSTYHEADWPIVYANDLFVYGKGDCFSYGAAFAYMAKAIGCSDCYACNSGGHGWAEVEGLIYDAEWSMHSKKYSYYAMSYDEPCDVRYASGIAAGYWWMRMEV